MKIFLKVFMESVGQALQQLYSNRLRSFLSLLGITIGIFCIIGVQSAVDSLERSVRGSLDKLGDDVLYVQKMPWNEDPDIHFWKYMRRPSPSYTDREIIKERVKSAGLVDYHVFLGFKPIKYRSNSVNGAYSLAITNDFEQLLGLKFEKGRFFTPAEYFHGSNKLIIGANVAEELFGSLDPIGKEVKLMGHKHEIIGVVERSGRSLISLFNYDDGILMGYETARKMAVIKGSGHRYGNSSVIVKAGEGYSLEQLKDEVTGVLRSHHRLRPKEADDFSLNNLSLLASVMDSIFGALGMAGLIVGGFAIFVGMFSVANIMFVSVKERTNIIGIKKALGAKQSYILLEFLIEAVILCIIGGVAGLLFVVGVTAILSNFLPFDMVLSSGNIITGIVLSASIGLLSGFIPAFQAARLDPVEAIRK
ncbi:MAG: ABC transporter permease [Saprospirales bacterium]|nr:ABC transporter permease [Saprospirales bacterium]MBK7336385.1 ABC transporter permease [Saprospirales bacterium]